MFVSKFFLCFALFSISLCARAEEEGGRIDLSKQGLFEGDIQTPPRLLRNGIFASQRWTNGIIPYDFQGDAYRVDYINMVTNGMREIESQTCVRFKPRTNETNYITIYKGQGCSSQVGMFGGRQYVSLQDPGCWYHSTIVHELLHAVGLWHEQSRYDRDDYLIINLQNVVQGMGFNFDLKTQSEASTYGVPYNYESVMHYSKTAFTKNGEITMETIDPDMQDRIGQAETGVDTDYEKVRRIYQCTGTYPPMPRPVYPPPPPCEDKMTYCADLKGNCNSDGALKTYCRKTCGFCTPDCRDEVTYCKDYKKQRQCNVQAWLKTSCKKTCGFCAPY